MPDVLQDAKTIDFLQTEWAKSTSYRQKEIAKAIEEFIRDNPNSTQFSYWSDNRVERIG